MYIHLQRFFSFCETAESMDKYMCLILPYCVVAQCMTKVDELPLRYNRHVLFTQNPKSDSILIVRI